MEKTKVKSKKYDLSKVSKGIALNALLDIWKKDMIVEAKTRKDAFKTKSNFAKWWANYLALSESNEKVWAATNEIEKLENKTDFEKDLLDERDRILKDIDDLYDKLDPVKKMMVDNKDKVFNYLATPELKKYEVKIKSLFFWDIDHLLSPEEEKIMNDFENLSSLSTIFNTLSDEVVIVPIYDKNGNKIPGNTSWKQLFTCNDRYIRKQAYIASKSFGKNSPQTLFEICKASANFLTYCAKKYKYSNWIEQKAHFYYDLKFKDYGYILDQCTKFADINTKYRMYNANLIIKAYDLAEYAPWDYRLKIKNTTDSISINEAKTIVKEALSCLGDEYIDKLNVCYKNNIINWKQDNKYASSYCLSVSNEADENLIGFNWQGNSVSTIALAHELGHNIRNKFLKENNEINNWSHRLTSELPSIVNSILMAFYLIKNFKKENKPKEQLYGVYKYIIDYLVYCINQTAFYIQFAYCFNKWVLKEANFSWRDMNQMYLDLKKRYYGMSESDYKKQHKYPYNLEKTKCFSVFFNTANTWQYVLAYYVGAIVALPVAWKIFNGDKKTLDKYYKFLKAGTTLDPIKSLKDTMGINLLKPEIYTECKKIFNELVNQFIKDIKI